MNSEPDNNEFSKQLEIISKYDNGFLHPSWLNAAGYFHTLAEKNNDISVAVPHLLTIYTESNHVDIMEHVGKAVIKHALNIGNNELIKNVLTEKQYPDYFLRPFLKYISKNKDLDNVLLEIAIHFTKNEFIVADIFIMYIKANPKKSIERLEKIVAAIQQYKTLKNYLPRFLREASCAGIDIAEHIFLIVSILEDKKRKKAVSCELGTMVAYGADIYQNIEKLNFFLSDPEINYNISYSLGLYFIKKSRFNEFDSLANHAETNVRKGALQGLNARFTNSENASYELLHRVIRGFFDSDTEINQLVATILKAAKRKKIDILPNKTDCIHLLNLLVEYPERNQISEYLVSCMQENEPFLNEISLLFVENQFPQLLPWFQFIINQIISNTYPKICAICENLPRRKVYNFNFDVPKEVELLHPTVHLESIHNRTTLTCPICGNTYSYSYHQEYEDMSVSTEIMIKRMFPTDFLHQLKGAELANYKKQLPEKILFYQSLLTHVSNYLNEDAVYFLTQYFRDSKQWKELSELFSKLNMTPKQFMLQLLIENQPEKIKDLMFIHTLQEYLIGNIQEILPVIKRNIATQICIFYMLNRQYSEIEKYLQIDDVHIITGATKALYYCQTNNLADVSAFFTVLSALTNTKNGDLRDYAKWTCDILLQQYPERFKINSTIIKNLKSRYPERLKDALSKIEICLDNNENIAWALNLIGRLIKKNEVANYALNTIKKALTKKINIQEIIPFLIDELKNKKQACMNEILIILKSAIDSGFDIEQAYMRMAQLLHENNGQYRINALYIFDTLLSLRYDLTFAENDLKKAHKGQKDWYDEKIIYMLTDIYLRNKNYDQLNELLLSNDRNIRSAALAYLCDYPQKEIPEFENFIKSIEANLESDYWYIKEKAEAAMKLYINS
jgi:hypothetical protein